MGDPAMLTTLTRLQGELKNTSAVTSQAAASELTSLILECSYDIAKKCNRRFDYVSNYVEMVSGYATPFLTVRYRNPIDITQPLAVAFNASVFDPSTYTINANQARLGRVYNRYGWYWTALLLPNVQMDPFTGYENPLYQVTYSGGYVTPQQALDNPTDPILSIRTLPYDIERACLDYCVAKWAMRGQNPLLKSERLMSYSYQLASTENVTAGKTGIPSVDNTVMAYRRTGTSR